MNDAYVQLLCAWWEKPALGCSRSEQESEPWYQPSETCHVDYLIFILVLDEEWEVHVHRARVRLRKCTNL